MIQRGVTIIVALAMSLGFILAHGDTTPRIARASMAAMSYAGMPSVQPFDDPDCSADTCTPTPTSTPTVDLTATEQTAEAQQTATATEQTAEAQQTATATEQTAEAQQTATATEQTAEAQQTATAQAATATQAAIETQTAAAQETIVATTIIWKNSLFQTAAAKTATAAAAQQTAIAAAQQTAIAAAQQTAITAQQTAIAAQQTAAAGGVGALQTANAAQQTANAAQQTVATDATATPGQTTSAGTGNQGGTPGMSPDSSVTPTRTSVAGVIVGTTSTQFLTSEVVSSQQATSATLQSATTPMPSTGSINSSSSTVPTASNGSSNSGSHGTGTGKTLPASLSTQLKNQVAGPVLRVRLLAPLVQPGAVENIVIAYAGNALVDTQVFFPGHPRLSIIKMTDRHGTLTLAVSVPANIRLHNGQATARVLVHAVTGSWHVLKLLTPDLRAGVAGHIAISSVPTSYIRSDLTLPGQPPVSHLSVTDANGRLTLNVNVSPHTRLPGGRAIAHMSISNLTVKQQAQVTSNLNISDMVVSMTVGRFVRCAQTEVVHIAYRPNTSVRIDIQFPHDRHLIFSRRTDRSGAIVAPIDVSYVKAVSPVKITVHVDDTTPNSRRTTSIAYAVSLPRACQKTT